MLRCFDQEHESKIALTRELKASKATEELVLNSRCRCVIYNVVVSFLIGLFITHLIVDEAQYMLLLLTLQDSDAIMHTTEKEKVN